MLKKVNFQTRMAVFMFYYIIYLLWTDPKEFLYMLFKHVLTADPFCTIRCVASNDRFTGLTRANVLYDIMLHTCLYVLP